MKIRVFIDQKCLTTEMLQDKKSEAKDLAEKINILKVQIDDIKSKLIRRVNSGNFRIQYPDSRSSN